MKEYKIGDTVRIKDYEWYKKNANSEGDIISTVPIFDQKQSKYCGTVAKIILINKNPMAPNQKEYYLDFDKECRFAWSSDMFDEDYNPKINNQNRIWSELSEESKKEIIEEYNKYAHPFTNEQLAFRKEYGNLFGEHNLHPQPQIKTWDDMEKECPNIKSEIDTLNYHISTCIAFGAKIDKKLIATYKIAKLIELGYGGLITDEEWRDEKVNKFSLVCEANRLSIICLPDERHFISFHYLDEAERFLAESKNKDLIKDYFML